MSALPAESWPLLSALSSDAQLQAPVAAPGKASSPWNLYVALVELPKWSGQDDEAAADEVRPLCPSCRMPNLPPYSTLATDAG